MADVVINAEVKSNIGDVSKDASSAAGEFKLMGVSLNGVKRGFASAAVTAKGMFGSIKAGLISTGIGAFLVLLGSLLAYFSSTKRGAEKLEVAMAGLGAVVSIVTDLFSSLGETIINVFTDSKQSVSDFTDFMKDRLLNRLTGVVDGFIAAGKVIESVLSFDWEGVKEGAEDYGEALIQIGTGMDVEQQKAFIEGIKETGKAIAKNVSDAMRLKEITQQLKDEEREFSKVRAQTRQDIQKARLDALDESKTAEERLAAVQKANDLELKTTEDALEMQRRKIEVQKEVMSLSENMAEDLDELAALEVGLIDLQTQSFQTQKRLATEMETLTNEIAAKEKEAQKVIDDEKAVRDKKIIDDAKKVADAKIKETKRVADVEKQIATAVESFKKATIQQGFGAAAAMAGENVALSKGVAAAQVIYNTQQGIMAAMGATSVADKLLPFPLRLANAISTGVMGAAALSTVMSTSPSGGGSNPVPSPSGGGGTPAPQMMSGSFDISGGVAPEPVQAFVLTDSMTNSQNQLANIRRRATI